MTYTVTIKTKAMEKRYHIEAKTPAQAKRIALKDWKYDFGKLKYEEIEIEN